MAPVDPDQPALNPFQLSECFLMSMPLGKQAANLREPHKKFWNRNAFFN